MQCRTPVAERERAPAAAHLLNIDVLTRGTIGGMNTAIRHHIVALACALAPLAHAASPSPYAGQQSREIKALSSAEQADLLAGKGMGLAKAAELNGYPGPAHVLELAADLALSAEQRARTQAVWQAMDARAKAIGQQVIDAERELDALFASKQVTRERLAAQLDRIGALQGQLRAVHLDAHLEQVRILTPEQTSRYAVLRGYTGEGSGHGGHGGHGGTGHRKH
jgi:Spy/CpxP family protein refolding chaperone